MADHFDPRINSVAKLYDEYLAQERIAHGQVAATDEGRQAAQKALLALQPRIREVIELANTEFLRLKFDRLVTATIRVLPIMAIALFVFLVSTHRDDRTERQLDNPIVLQIPWGAQVEAAMQRAGLEQKCFAPTRPLLLQCRKKPAYAPG
jgi:hypothetical protein